MIVATICARDEENIIGQCIEHHLQSVNKIILTDNGSVDRTKEIASRYKEVEIIDQPDHDYRHGEWVTKMARMAWKMGAKWVANIDADEFWVGLERVYDVVNSVSVIRLPPNYDYLTFQDATDLPFNPTDFPFWTRSVQSLRLVHRAFENVVVTDGNHDVYNCRGGCLYTNEIYVKHYPIRSYSQFEKKVIKGGTALLKSPQHGGMSTHWRKWYGDYQNGNLRKIYDEMAIARHTSLELVNSGKVRAKILL